MKVPPNFAFRKGDTVTVVATVKFSTEEDDDRVHVILDRHVAAAVALAQVRTIEGRIWDSGDYVRNVNDHDDHGEVVAFAEGMAWVKLASGAFTTYAALDLEPFDKPETPES